jgi:hypothetical protein
MGHGMGPLGNPSGALWPLTSHRIQVASNLVEAGEDALVLHSGYFGDSFADW